MNYQVFLKANDVIKHIFLVNLLYFYLTFIEINLVAFLSYSSLKRNKCNKKEIGKMCFAINLLATSSYENCNPILIILNKSEEQIKNMTYCKQMKHKQNVFEPTFWEIILII
jgi:hypothetical protein